MNALVGVIQSRRLVWVVVQFLMQIQCKYRCDLKRDMENFTKTVQTFTHTHTAILFTHYSTTRKTIKHRVDENELCRVWKLFTILGKLFRLLRLVCHDHHHYRDVCLTRHLVLHWAAPAARSHDYKEHSRVGKAWNQTEAVYVIVNSMRAIGTVKCREVFHTDRKLYIICLLASFSWSAQINNAVHCTPWQLSRGGCN